ncbi:MULTISPECIES: MFS transporter [unclassified Frankia]
MTGSDEGGSDEGGAVVGRTAGTGAGASPGGGAPPGRGIPGWAVLAVCCLAQFMVVLDISIVNVALPSMQTDLGMTASGLQWVVNAYTIAFAGLLLFGGRAVQGLGGAVLAPATLTLLMTSFAEGQERTRALGAWGATAASGGALGAIVGGALTEVANWRWVLFVNVPIGVALLVAARLVLVESRGQLSRLRDLDIPGTVTVTGGLVLSVYGIVRTESSSWTSPVTLGMLAGAVVLLAAFVVVEVTTPAPLVPLSIFRYPGLAAANAVAAFLGAAMFTILFFLTLFLQQAQGYSPLRTGVAMLPIPLMVIVASRIVTRMIGRLGPRPIIVFGLMSGTAGLLWLSTITRDGSYWVHVFGPVLIIGLGVGPVMVAAATAGVPMRLAGLASGLINISRQIGAAIGLAAVSTIATRYTDGRLRHGAARLDALASGYSLGLFIGGCVLAAGILAALLLPRVRRPEPEPALGAAEKTASGASDDEDQALAEV